MNHLIILLGALCLGACSSTPKKEASAEQKEDAFSPEIQQEFAWIENADFAEVAEAPFLATNDKFEESFSDNDSLAQESIARLPQPKIEDAIDSDDVVTKLSGLCHAKKFAEAFQLVAKQHRRYRKHPAFWNQVGTCHLSKRDLRSAIVFYNKSRELDSKYAPPLNNLGVIYQVRGSLQKAALAYKEASKLNQLSLTPLFNLAQLQLRGGQVEPALYAFQALVKKNDDDVDAVAGFATALMIRGDIEQANRVYDRLSSESLKNPAYGVNYALSLKLAGNNDKARQVLASVASTPDQGMIAYYNKVKNFVYQGGL